MAEKLASPQPDYPSELEHEEHTNPAIRASNLRTRIIVLIVSGGFSALSLGCVAYAYDKLEAKARDAGTDAAMKSVSELAAKVEGDHATLQVVLRQQDEQRDDLHEIQKDIRALYKTTVTGERQERLERPPAPKDGGP